MTNKTTLSLLAWLRRWLALCLLVLAPLAPLGTAQAAQAAQVLFIATSNVPAGKFRQLAEMARPHGIALQVRYLERLPADTDDAVVFHAGSEMGEDGLVRTSGGRVLCVTALAESVKLAQQRVYDVARGIYFDGAQYRRDIGYRAVKNS